MGWFNNDSDEILEQELERLRIRDENYRKRRDLQDAIRDLESEVRNFDREIDSAKDNLRSVGADGDMRESDRWRYEIDKLLAQQSYLGRKIYDLKYELNNIPYN